MKLQKTMLNRGRGVMIPNSAEKLLLESFAVGTGRRAYLEGIVNGDSTDTSKVRHKPVKTSEL